MANFNFLTTGGITQFDSLLPATARDLLQRQNWQEFQSDIDERLQIYSDDWRDILIGVIKSRLSLETQNQFFPDGTSPKWPIPLTMNLLKKVVNQISQVYNDNAKRAYVEEKEEIEEEIQTDIEEGDVKEPEELASERYSEIVKSGFNAKMQLVNRMTNLCNVVLVRPVPDPELRFSTTGFRFDILTPDQFTPIQHPDDPSSLIGVFYSIDLTDTPGGTITNVGLDTITRIELLFYIGTGEDGDEPFFAESNNLNDKEIEKQPYVWRDPNGKPYLPFAVFRKEEPLTGQFVNRTSGDDLTQGTKEASNQLSRWLRSLELNATGKQLIVSGAGAEKQGKTIIMDQANVLIWPMAKEDAIISNIDHQVKIQTSWDALKSFVESILDSYDLSIEKFSGQAQSGVSLKLKNEGLRTRIEGQWPLYRDAENRLAWLVRRENNRALPSGEFGTISETGEFRINFGDLPFEPEPLENVDKMLTLAEQDIMSKAQILMKIDPDIPDLEAAQEQLILNKQLNRKAAGGILGLGAMGEPIPPVAEEPGEKTESQEEILEDGSVEIEGV